MTTSGIRAPRSFFAEHRDDLRRLFVCLAGALVVAGAARVGQVGAQIDEVLAHGFGRLGVSRLGAGLEDDRDAIRIAIGDRLIPQRRSDLASSFAREANPDSKRRHCVSTTSDWRRSLTA